VSDWALITPDQVEDLLILVLRERHAEHLAAQERRRDLSPQTLERLKTVQHWAAPLDRLSSDTHPSALVGSVGTARAPERNHDDGIDVAWQVAVEVGVMGQSRRDTLRRRDWTAWTVIECLLQRTPRDGVVSALRLSDVEYVDEGDAQRILGTARILFEVDVPNMVTIAGLPVHDDPHWEPGGPGGPPPDDEPYTEPEPLPESTDVGFEIERTPIT